ncbi:bifunctional lysylphosphatidylglycerol flippase/synthetase MprF [Streptomyces sp. NPDC059010]|uniref:bifunctional lysylphosphatidylglycerol flippase/synthetase MprF n=1 Tax=Streptomyces sp. NPDC059010 TaxID=3346695 RepID=UPI00367C7198
MPSTPEVPEAPEVSDVLDALEYSDNPSGFLALNTGNDVFTAPGLRGAVVYRTAGRHLVQFAGPLAPDADYEALLARFTDFAAERRKRILAVQLQRADADIYAGRGFTVNQIGASYAIDLKRFTLRGSRFVKLRNKISRARRSGLVVEEAEPARWARELDSIDAQWLRAKGRHTKELNFLVGERGGAGDARRRLFLGRLDGTPVAYITYVPVHGSRPGWLHDLTRRRPEVPPGVMETINVTAIERFTEEGAAWLHLGFTPFTGLDEQCETPGSSPLVRRLVGFLAAHGEAVYPAATQLAYKEKWGPHTVLPEYIAFQGRPGPGAVWQLMRTANAV